MAEINWDQLTKDWLKFRQEFYMKKQELLRHAGHVELKCAKWIEPLIDPANRRAAVEATCRRMLDFPAFDAIAFTGLSGSVVAGAVAMTMDKYLYCVRKSDENRHSTYQVEGPLTGLRYVIIDDFICTGSTIERITELVHAHTEGKAECVGAYLWRDDDVRTDLSHYISKLPRHLCSDRRTEVTIS